MALRLAVYSFMQKSAIPQFRRSVFFYGKESLAVIKRFVTFVTNSGQNRVIFIKKPADYPQIV